MSTKETVQGLIHYLVTDSNSLLLQSSSNNKKNGKRRKRPSRNGVVPVPTTMDNSEDEYESLSLKLNNRRVLLGANENEYTDYNNVSSQSLCSINLTEEDNTNTPSTGTVIPPTEEEEDIEEEAPLPSLSLYEQQMTCIRYPYIACEVICCEINSIIDTLVDSYVDNGSSVEGDFDSCASNDGSRDEQSNTKSEMKRISLLDLLFSLLDQEVMDDRLGGYFEKVRDLLTFLLVNSQMKKVLMVLFLHRPSSLGSYINSGGLPLFHKLIRHIYNHSIMQILLKLLLPPPPQQPQLEEPGTFAYNTTTDADEDTYNENDFQRALKCSWHASPETLSLLVNKLTVTFSEDENVWIASHHSAELLIYLIQNSTLDSDFLKTLTSDADLIRSIVNRATLLRDGEEFVPYESPMTYATNVLEVMLL